MARKKKKKKWGGVQIYKGVTDTNSVLMVYYCVLSGHLRARTCANHMYCARIVSNGFASQRIWL